MLFDLLFGKKKYTDLKADAFEAGLTDKNIVVIDVRTAGEYNGGHLKNARLIDIMSTKFLSEIEKLDKEKNYYVYCRSGGRSSKACKIMTSKGFKNVFNLSGGIMSWTSNGKKVIK